MICSHISKKTLNELEKILNEYKINVLDDINNHFKLNIDRQVFRDMFLKRNNIIINIKKSPIDFNKCHAIVYYTKYGYNQCKRSNSQGNYCNIHNKNRFYGSIKLNNTDNYEDNSANNSIDNYEDNSIDNFEDNSIDNFVDNSANNSIDNSIDNSANNSIDNSIDNS